MTGVMEFVGGLLSLLRKFKKLFKGTDTKTVAASVVATVLTVAILGGGYLLVNHGLVSSTREVDLGGLDLGGYCASYNYGDNDQNSCSSAIDLSKARSWTWGAPMRAEVTGVYSTGCYPVSQPTKKVGGIRNMQGYCAYVFPDSAGVQATSPGGKWACRTSIDKGAACAWQYQKQGLKARQVGGLWHCYIREKS